jgi:DNA-binding GntR family transcriptional regulator
MSTLLDRAIRIDYFLHSVITEAKHNHADKKQHQAIVISLKKNDLPSALRLITEHIQYSKQLVLEAFNQSPQLQRVSVPGF